MSQQNNKLKSKDLIIAGAFAALYVVALFLTVSCMGFIPLLYLMAPFFMSIVLGPIYMLYVMKVPKTGAILILSVVVGLVTSLGGMWFTFIWCIVIGLIAEIIARAGKYRSRKWYAASFVLFACTNMGPFWALIIAKDAFLQSCVGYYGQEYANTLDALVTDWVVVALIGIAILGGILGAALGTKLLKKHFQKAGVV